jgi:diguanylate cyclase (GGDEF)-like protein
MIDITERKTLEKELLESVHKMEILARTDQLTGILNRRAIMEKGREELSRSRREGNGLGICLIDIDNLKEINDRFGHLAGDSALRLVAKTIRQLCRDYDQVGRWGGDEFLMFVPNVPRSALREIAERIRFQIDVADLVSPDGDAIAVQVCIGIAHSGDMEAVDNELEHLISLADNGLYVAKGQGRNRVGEVQDI